MNTSFSDDIILRLYKLYGIQIDTLPDNFNKQLFPLWVQSKTEIFFRYLLAGFVSKIPENCYEYTTKKIKRFLKSKKNIDNRSTIHSFEKIFSDFIPEDDALLNTCPKPLVLTHDVDLLKGYKQVEKILNIENDLDISSTWHFLTDSRYTLDHSLLSDFMNTGHDIGFHGLWHDLAIGYRNRKKQVDILKRGKEKLAPYEPVSYRAPGLSWSIKLHSSLKESGFRADSSLRNYNNGWGIYHPIPSEDGKLWELPLTLQDDFLFKNLKLSNEQASDYLFNLLNNFESKNALVLLNFHPSIVKDRLTWYKKFLNKIIQSGKWKITTVRNIIRELDSALTLLKSS